MSLDVQVHPSPELQAEIDGAKRAHLEMLAATIAAGICADPYGPSATNDDERTTIAKRAVALARAIAVESSRSTSTHVIDVLGCARCGGDHLRLQIAPLTRPIAPPELAFAWSHWAPCPTNGEPIIVAHVRDAAPAFLHGIRQ